MIKPIDTWSVEQITSGQVVTSLSSAVKELVENSLDAGATVIEVKLINHGKDGFSVTDNGHGIDPEDFEFIARKHATSKLRGFEDLSSIQTLGFRGEALASLCALAEITLTTNSGSGASGYELKFDHTGKITNQRLVAAPRGTAISVNKLFDQLPVRRKTFERGSAREFAKTVELIQEYALLNSVTLTVEHIVKTRSNSTLRSHGAKLNQRIACVYGAKRTKTLQLIEPEQHGSPWKLSGYISKPVFGMGDSASTCQLIAINGRPTLHPRLVRAIVELYKQYNFTEQPFFIIDICLPPESFDVNVTPDKRTLLLHNEDNLINEIKGFLEVSFSNSGHCIPRMSQIEPPVSKKPRQSLVNFATFSGSGSVIDQERRLASRSAVSPGFSHEDSYDNFLARDEENLERQCQNEEAEIGESELSDEALDTPALDGNERHDSVIGEGSRASSEASRGSNLPKNSGGNSSILNSQCNESTSEEESSLRLGSSSGLSMPCQLQKTKNSNSSIQDRNALLPSFASSEPYGREENEDNEENVVQQEEEQEEEHTNNIKERSVEENTSIYHNDDNTSVELASLPHSTQEKQQDANRASVHLRSTLNTHIHLPLTMQSIDTAMQEASNSQEKTMKRLQTLAIDEEGTEERLQLNIRKEDFDQMEVVGQFNLGFILVVNRKSSHDDLFVIDQHASDEIYNFERLQSSTVLSRQPLVVPQTLELSAAEELTIQDNMSIFENNGFTIQMRPDNPPGSQCVLTSVPYSKSTVFNERDVFELLSKLKEDSNQPKLRCSKLRSMFAMRACRSSIMIGTPLKSSTMNKVVRHMGTLNKPWNCPHGRPTLRHITTLS